MFKSLIDRASSLITRLEVVKQAVDEDRFKSLTNSQHVAGTEIDSWFAASAELISEVYGKDSEQIQNWQNERTFLKEIREHNADAGTFEVVDSYIRDILTMRGLLMGYQDVYEGRSRKLERERRHNMSITISGGTFVGSQIGGVANNMQTYIEQLKLGEYSSDEEKQLKEALAKLRKGIEEADELNPPEKTAAATDLALLTDQLVKPVDKQDGSAKKLFWDRLKTVLSVSAGLGSLLAVVSKLAGLG